MMQAIHPRPRTRSVSFPAESSSGQSSPSKSASPQERNGGLSTVAESSDRPNGTAREHMDRKNSVLVNRLRNLLSDPLLQKTSPDETRPTTEATPFDLLSKA